MVPELKSLIVRGCDWERGARLALRFIREHRHAAENGKGANAGVAYYEAELPVVVVYATAKSVIVRGDDDTL